MSFRHVLPRAAVIGGLVFSFAFAACSDSDPMNPDPHADVQAVLVEVVGGGSVTFNRQHVASGDLTLGNNAVVAVTFQDANGEEDATAQNPDNFELRVNYPGGNPAGLAFTLSPTNPFAGTFTRTTPTTTPTIVQFELFHLTGDHNDGRWNAQAVVQ